MKIVLKSATINSIHRSTTWDARGFSGTGNNRKKIKPRDCRLWRWYQSKEITLQKLYNLNNSNLGNWYKVTMTGTKLPQMTVAVTNVNKK